MIRQKSSSHAISGLFVFLLLGIFAVFGTVIVVLGVKAYRGVNERSDAHMSRRIGPAYLRSMLRSADTMDGIVLETIDGIETISLIDRYGDDEYATRIYVSDGHLCEWFSDVSLPFEPGSGDTVCEAEALSAHAEDGHLTVTLTAGGETHDITCALRAARP